jgi:hypothetical protein
MEQMNYELEIDELKERVIRLEAQIKALEYLALPKEELGRFAEVAQDKMYRLSKAVTEKLKPVSEDDFTE